MKLVIAIIVAVLIAGMACPCFAGLNPNCKMGVHLQTHSAKRSCGSLPVITSQGDLKREWDASLTESVDAIIYIWGHTEFIGFQLGMQWPSEWGTGVFTSCGNLTVGGINNWDDDGIAITYDSEQGCQTPDGFAGIGWLWLYATGPGHVGIRGHFGAAGYLLEVLDCNKAKDQPETVFWAARDTLPLIEGPPAAAEPVTWGTIKALFK